MGMLWELIYSESAKKYQNIQRALHKVAQITMNSFELPMNSQSLSGIGVGVGVVLIRQSDLFELSNFI